MYVVVHLNVIKLILLWNAWKTPHCPAEKFSYSLYQFAKNWQTITSGVITKPIYQTPTCKEEVHLHHPFNGKSQRNSTQHVVLLTEKKLKQRQLFYGTHSTVLSLLTWLTQHKEKLAQRNLMQSSSRQPEHNSIAKAGESCEVALKNAKYCANAISGYDLIDDFSWIDVLELKNRLAETNS